MGLHVNDQWRVGFVWKDGAAWDVEIVDHHQAAARLGVLFGMESRVLAEPAGAYDLALTREALPENLAAIHPLAAAA